MATLAELTERLRLRLGEIGVERGTWDNETELKLYLNTSQVELAKLLHSRGDSWSEKIGIKIPVEDKAEYYVLPANFMVEERIAHHHPNWGYRRLSKENIQDIRYNKFDSLHYSGPYAAYEVRGSTDLYVALGVADAGSNGQQLVDTGANFSDVRVGDIVHNLNDDSHATVSDFFGGTVQIGEWRGGYSQRFYAGDGYRIASRERTADQLWVYPPLNVKGDIIALQNLQASGANATFRLNEDILINKVEFQVSSLPADWQEDDILSVSFDYFDVDGYTKVRGSGFGMQKIRIGYNTIPNFQPFRLRQNIDYRFLTFGGASISNLKLYQESDNFIFVNYTPLPAPMLYDYSICEFADEFHEPLLDHAKMLAYDKIFPNGEMYASLRQRFDHSLQKSREFRQVAEAGLTEYVNGYGGSGGSERMLNSQPGYTLHYGKVDF